MWLMNLDKGERVHDMRADHQNKSLQACPTSMVFNTVLSDHLPDNSQHKNIATSRNCSIVRCRNSHNLELKVLIAKILVQKLTELLGKVLHSGECTYYFTISFPRNSSKPKIKSEFCFMFVYQSMWLLVQNWDYV